MKKCTLILSLLLAACGHDHGDHDDHGDDHSEATVTRSAGHASLALTLDNGKKWPVDAHTRASAGKLMTLARETPIKTVEDARGLAKGFDAGLAELVGGCTMRGAAHDQLHVFLVAFFPKVDELRDITDLGELQAVRAEVLSLFEAYEQHFE